MPKIKLSIFYTLNGTDRVSLDVGEGWGVVQLNGKTGNRYYVFYAYGEDDLDTLNLQCAEKNGCYDSLLIIIEQKSVAVKNILNALKIKVAPIPASTMLTVTMDTEKEWIIFNALSKPVLKGFGSGMICAVDIPFGSYFLNIVGGQTQRVEILR